jgi:hypothetical protein
VECISLAVHPAAHLKIVVPQDSLTVRTGQALRVELLPPLRLEVLPLNPSVTTFADAPIQLVVVALAVWRIIDHVEGGRLEGLHAGGADKTLLVIPTSQPPISGRDGFASDGFTASFAVALLRRPTAEGYLALFSWGLGSSRVTWWRLGATSWIRRAQFPS